MSENLTTREQQLLLRERAVLDREKSIAAKEKEFSPRIRLTMTAAAQGLGFLLLFVLGMGISWPTNQPDITRGFSFVRKIGWIYLIITIAVPAIVMLVSLVQKRIKQGHTDIILLSYVGTDILLLLLLVRQEGGLCRSMFLPVFFLIPTAYLIVERRENKFRWRRLVVLLAIVGAICCGYLVSLEHQPPEMAATLPVQGTVRILWSSKQITDFDALAHREYDDAVFYASLIAAFIPIIQIVVIMVRDRLRDDRSEDDESQPLRII